MDKENFLAKVVGNQIANSCKSRMVRVGPDQVDPQLWAKHLYFMARQIAIVNRCLKNVKPELTNEPFYQLFQLLVMDVIVEGNLWQCHIKGFFAFIESLGGIGAVLKSPRQIRSVRHILK